MKTKKTTSKTSKPKENKELIERVDETFEAMADIYKHTKFVPITFFIDFEWMMVAPNEKKENAGFSIILADPDMVEARFEVMHTIGSLSMLLGMIGLAGKPKYVRMASEAWASEGDDKGNRPTMQPSKDPKRKSVLIVAGVDASGFGTQNMKEIKTSIKTGKGSEMEYTIEYTASPIMKKLEEAGAKEQMESPLLNNFWKGFQVKKEPNPIMVEIIRKKGQEDPQGAIQGVVDAALQTAQMFHKATQK